MTPQETLERMHAASDHFYDAARRVNCHAFIEFTGLMNEYIQICKDNLDRDIDFRDASAHTGKQLKIMPHQVAYLNEKLQCIFQGLIVLGQETDE